MNLSPLFTAQPDGPQLVTGGASAIGAELPDVLAAEQSFIRALLGRNGAILFRGFGLRNSQQFSQCMAALAMSPFSYVGGDSPRTAVSDGVYTSTEYPSTASISLHHEMSYLPNWPTFLAFFAEMPPVANGQTSLAVTAAVTEAIDPAILARFSQRGLKYIRSFGTGQGFGKSWQQTFATDDRDRVQQLASDQQSQIFWLEDAGLRVETNRPALLPVGDHNALMWFNQAEQWHPSALSPHVRRQFADMLGDEYLPHDCKFGDGSDIELEDLLSIRRAMARSKRLFDWQIGDLLILDNRLMMHGREPFAGHRRILAYLAA